MKMNSIISNETTQTNRILSPYSYIKYYNKVAEHLSDVQFKEIDIPQELGVTKFKNVRLNRIKIPKYMQMDHERKEKQRNRILSSPQNICENIDIEELKIQRRMEDLISTIAENKKREEDIVFRSQPAKSNLKICKNEQNTIDFIDTTQKKYFSITQQQTDEIYKHKSGNSTPQRTPRNTIRAEKSNFSLNTSTNQINTSRSSSFSQAYQNLKNKQDHIVTAQYSLDSSPKESNPLHFQISSESQANNVRRSSRLSVLQTIGEKFQRKLDHIAKNKNPELYMSKTIQNRRNVCLRKILTSVPEEKLKKIYEIKRKYIQNLLDSKQQRNNQINNQNPILKFKSISFDSRLVQARIEQKKSNGRVQQLDSQSTQRQTSPKQSQYQFPGKQQFTQIFVDVNKEMSHSDQKHQNQFIMYSRDSIDLDQKQKQRLKNTKDISKSLYELNFRKTMNLKTESCNSGNLEIKQMGATFDSGMFRVQDRLLTAFDEFSMKSSQTSQQKYNCLENIHEEKKFNKLNNQKIPSFFDFPKYFKSRYSQTLTSLRLTNTVKDINDKFENHIQQLIDNVN